MRIQWEVGGNPKAPPGKRAPVDSGNIGPPTPPCVSNPAHHRQLFAVNLILSESTLHRVDVALPGPKTTMFGCEVL
jgi:hypothetical protein